MAEADASAATDPTQASGSQAPPANTGLSGTAAPTQDTAAELTRLQAEIERLSGERDQFQNAARGNRQWYETAKKLGLRSPEDFEARLSPLLKPPDDDHSDERDNGKPKGEFDPDKLSQDLEAKFERKLALKDHETAQKAEQRLVKDFVAKHTEGKSKRDAALIEHAVKGLVADSTKGYPKDHPLHGSHYSPLTEADFEAMSQQIASWEAESEGEELSKIGEAASKPKPRNTTTPAGNSGGQGAPDGDGPRAFHELSRAEREAISKRLLDRRRKAPTAAD